MKRRKKGTKPGEKALLPRDVSIELTKAVAALAYKWLLEHRAALMYSLAVKDTEHFVISSHPHGKANQQIITAEELADLVVEDHLAGATPAQD